MWRRGRSSEGQQTVICVTVNSYVDIVYNGKSIVQKWTVKFTGRPKLTWKEAVDRGLRNLHLNKEANGS